MSALAAAVPLVVAEINLTTAYVKLVYKMKLMVLYRPRSEHGRSVEEFIKEYQKKHGRSVEVLNIDTREGIATASLYDIWQYPAILVLQTDGYVQKIWQGDKLPLLDEVSAYVMA